ncbi:MAG: hypothetical protein Q9227_000436 [Pyrenula ochraceoflavens]
MKQRLCKASKFYSLFQGASTPRSGSPKAWSCKRDFNAAAYKSADVLPVTATGPPPSPPVSEASQYGERVERRRRRQAELLQKGKDLRASQQSKQTGPLKRRFWKDVHVHAVDDGYQILLDSRPLRTPDKKILKVPSKKPHLAQAIALEWDLLESAQQGLKNHNIPMTAMAWRASDILEEEQRRSPKTRENIVQTAMRYFDTDTLLCWAPEKSAQDSMNLNQQTEQTDSLRSMQIETAQPIIGFLTSHVWPGVDIRPAFDSDSILPSPQPEMTRSIIRGWISGLSPYELAALERGVVACKSLLVAARLVVEWSQEFQHIHRDAESRFGIEEAAKASSLEVRWQTGMWGEVEDTHDVDKEDLRRQLGSVVLLVSGT